MTQTTDLLEAILLAAEKAADARNDEAVFGLLDRIENPRGPLWDLLRELRITCKFRYVERRLRRKLQYLQNWRDSRDYLSDEEAKHAGPSWAHAFIRNYQGRLEMNEPCGKCRICVRERLYPTPATTLVFNVRRLNDRKLARVLIEEKNRDYAGTLSEVLH